MDYGYSRCSTNETRQDINRQVRELKAAGAVEIFLEYEHGDAKVKSQQTQMFAQAQPGDSSIETGKYNPSLELAFAISDFFDKRIDEIFIYERGVENEKK